MGGLLTTQVAGSQHGGAKEKERGLKGSIADTISSQNKITYGSHNKITYGSHNSGSTFIFACYCFVT
jgi:hypothetical protein